MFETTKPVKVGSQQFSQKVTEGFTNPGDPPVRAVAVPTKRDDKRTCRCHVFRQVFLPASFSNSITPVSKLSGFNNRYLMISKSTLLSSQ